MKLKPGFTKILNSFGLFYFKPPEKITEFLPLHIDLHSHLIPGIDDGAKNIEDSISLVKQLNRLGYKKVITTPHIMSDSYRNTPAIISEGLSKLRTAIKNNGIPIEIQAAAEYYLDEYFETLIDKKEILTFGENYLLFELSLVMKPASLEGIIFKMISSGYKPVLAHPERYTYLFDKNLTKYREIKQSGILFQMNLSSLTNAYSPLVKNIAHQLIDNKMIDFAGSDLHNERQINYLKMAMKEKYFSKLMNCPLLNNTL